jgi:hypothetical protein
MQLQLQHKFNMLKRLKVEPEETFMCLCYHEGKVIAGTREGSLVVIDCKVRLLARPAWMNLPAVCILTRAQSQEVVEHKQKVHTGMVNVITSVGSIHLWSASDDGCINVWEKKVHHLMMLVVEDDCVFRSLAVRLGRRTGRRKRTTPTSRLRAC